MYVDEEICRRLYAEAGRRMTALGVRANLDGYRYLREAICLAMISGGVGNIQTGLYAPIAARAGKQPHCVERAIRTAIETAWTTGDLDEIERVFAGIVDPNRAKPTAGQFITTICRRMEEDGCR
ncbi:MAG: sporulation initiation factor Spo0A C-terminal domain-containing protein [Eubacteriales bacterium]|nr:sporulation initiation factor Spo0A C-terminal domain-containing protein [Eubacteriales bacterium]